MQSSLSRETLPALGVLNEALWSFFIAERWQVKWESNLGGSFVLGACGARIGSWQELARIDCLRVTVEDDEANACWEQLFLGVPASQKLAEESNVSSKKSRGNVVEACVGASFIASHEWQQRRFHFETVPPDALQEAAAIFSRFAACGVSTPSLSHHGDMAGIPALLEGAVLHSPHLRLRMNAAKRSVGIEK